MREVSEIVKSQRGMIGWRVAGIVCALSGLIAAPLSGSGVPRKLALLVGVQDYPKSFQDLKAVHDDVESFRRVLVGRFGFGEADILVLLDKEATAQAVGDALVRHLGAARPGDAAVFYFSGHGAQVPDFDGDEGDDLDEVLATYGTDGEKPETWLTDDMIRERLAKIRTDRCVVILDCCHAGTGTRGFGAGERFVEKTLPLGFHGRTNAGPEEAVVSGSHILLAACGAEELAVEDRAAGGLFTRALVAALRDVAGDATFMELIARVRGGVCALIQKSPRPDARQIPRIEGDPERSVAWAFGDGGARATPAVADPKSIRVALTTDKGVYRDGEALSITVDSSHDGYLRLYHIDAKGGARILVPTPASKADDRIWAGLPQRSTFKISEPPGTEILVAVVSEHPFRDSPIALSPQSGFVELGVVPTDVLAGKGIDPSADRSGKASAEYMIEVAPARNAAAP